MKSILKISLSLALVASIIGCDQAEEKISQDFTFQADEIHYVILTVPDLDRAKLKNAKREIAAFNKKYYHENNLRLTDIFLDPETKSKLLLIRGFDNKTSAMDFIQDAKINKEEFTSLDKKDFEIFATNKENYRKVVKQKSTEEYLQFYKKKYLN